MVVAVLLAHQAVLADGEPMVGGEDHVGVLGVARRLERLQDLADLRVHVGGVGVILGAVHLHGFARARERRQQLVPDLVVALVERMLRQVIRRHLDARGRIAVHVLLRRLPRIVRRIEAHI